MIQKSLNQLTHIQSMIKQFNNKEARIVDEKSNDGFCIFISSMSVYVCVCICEIPILSVFPIFFLHSFFSHDVDDEYEDDGNDRII